MSKRYHPNHDVYATAVASLLGFKLPSNPEKWPLGFKSRWAKVRAWADRRALHTPNATTTIGDMLDEYLRIALAYRNEN